MPGIDNRMEKIYLLYSGQAMQHNTTIPENNFTIFIKIIPILEIYSKDIMGKCTEKKFIATLFIVAK